MKSVKGERKMASTTLYELLGLSRMRADEIAKRVRATYYDSKTPDEWIKRLVEEFHIDQQNAEIFACGWFAGKYAGVSEVFNTVQKEMDRKELDLEEKRAKESRYSPPDGYA
jgi:hypothetical protein